MKRETRGAAPMGEAIRIELLGGLRISRGGQPLTGFLSRKVPALLAYLAVTGTPQPRERLATLLWGEVPEPFARGSLRQALANLNRLAGDSLIITRATVGLRPEALPWCDVIALEATLRGGRGAEELAALRAAADLYAGDFLEGVAIPGAEPFAEWALAQRARLRELALEAFRQLAVLEAAKGAHADAAATLRRLLELEPWHEEAHRQLMAALARAGRRSAALAQYAACRRLLAAELGVEPAVETTALYDRILRNALADDPPATPRQTDGAASRPARAIAALPTLPLPPTPLLGREGALAALATLLADPAVRLVTLVGPPGVGKTRLALQAASAFGADLPGDAAFVNLAPLTVAALVPAAIASALGLQEIGQQPIVADLARHLREWEGLLLLDNFEQVVASAPFVGDLLAACPRLRILVTSREALRLRGEHEFPVPPLDLPDPALPLTADALAAHGAVTLFVARARATRPDFALTGANAAAVAAICARLDGLPLALELAAARVKLFPPEVLLARLGEAASGGTLAMLSGGARDLPPRQQTLTAAIDWSYALLDPDEQRLFRALAVCADGGTLATAEALAGEEVARPVVELMASLIDKSLLHLRASGPAGDEPRFVQLETIREYAHDQLVAAGEAQATHRRQLALAISFAEEAETGLRSEAQVGWLRRLESEHDNLQATLAWCLQADEAADGLRLAGALAEYWCRRALFSTGHGWLSQLLAADAQDADAPTARAKALGVAGRLDFLRNDLPAAEARLAESVARWRALGPAGHRGLAEALIWLGATRSSKGDCAAARATIEEGGALARATGDSWVLALALTRLGMVLLTHGVYRAATAALAESLALWRSLGARWGLGWAHFYLGNAAEIAGEEAKARECYEESLLAWRAVREQWGIVSALDCLGNLLVFAGDDAAAEGCYSESLALLQQMGSHLFSAYPISRLAGLAARRGDAPEATRLYRDSLARFREHDYRRGLAEWLLSVAGAAWATGRPEPAARLLGAAAGLLDTLGIAFFPGDRADYARTVSATRAALGPAVFTAAEAQGRAAPFEQVIAEALGLIAGSASGQMN